MQPPPPYPLVLLYQYDIKTFIHYFVPVNTLQYYIISFCHEKDIFSSYFTLLTIRLSYISVVMFLIFAFFTCLLYDDLILSECKYFFCYLIIATNIECWVGGECPSDLVFKTVSYGWQDIAVFMYRCSILRLRQVRTWNMLNITPPFFMDLIHICSC